MICMMDRDPLSARQSDRRKLAKMFIVVLIVFGVGDFNCIGTLYYIKIITTMTMKMELYDRILKSGMLASLPCVLPLDLLSFGELECTLI